MLALLLLAAADPQILFACSFGARQIEVAGDGTRLTYRYGRPGRPELTLVGDASSGTLFYHRTLYARGDDQTLRFRNGEYDYVIYSGWSAPNLYLEGARDDSGLLVLRRGRLVRRLDCREGGEFLENPLFETLPQDAENRVPPQ